LGVEGRPENIGFEGKWVAMGGDVWKWINWISSCGRKVAVFTTSTFLIPVLKSRPLIFILQNKVELFHVFWKVDGR